MDAIRYGKDLQLASWMSQGSRTDAIYVRACESRTRRESQLAFSLMRLALGQEDALLSTAYPRAPACNLRFCCQQRDSCDQGT